MSNVPLKYLETNLVGEIVNIAITTTSTTIYAQFKDSKTGAVREPQSSTNVFVIDKDTENFEIILADSHSTTGGVTTITVNASGRNLNKYEDGTGSATGLAHAIGSEIGCAEIQSPFGTLNKIMDGTNNTTGQGFHVGDDSANDITIYFEDDQANPSFIRKDNGTGKILMSNDGINTFDPEAGGSGVSAGDGISITAGVLAVDLATTPGLQFTSNKLDLFLRANYGLTKDANGLYIDLASSNPGLYFNGSGELDTKLKSGGGLTSDSDGLQIDTEADLSHVESFVAGEAITADDAVALAPNQVEWGSVMTVTDYALGSANTIRKVAVKIVPKKTVTGVTTMYIVGNEAAASTMTMTVTVETDNGGEPSGTPVTNGTANTLDTSTWGASYAARTVTWGTGFDLTQGTTYWLVLSVDKTDGANYVNMATNTEYDQDMIAYERLTYDLDTGTWGSSVTNAPFFFYFDDPDTLGHYIMQCDADAHGRTWRFIGFAESTVAAEESVNVYTDYASALSGLTPDRDYFLSSTAGAITTTAPSGIIGAANQYKIGRAISTTELKIETGSKKIVKAPAQIAATTTYTDVIWFRARQVKVWGAAAGATAIANSVGQFDGTNNGCIANYGHTLTTTSQTTKNLYLITAAGANDYSGVGSISQIAVQNVITKSNAPANAEVWYEILG